MVSTASVVGFFRTILIILLVYYVLKWLTRLFFPLLIKKYFGGAAKQNSDPSKKEGDVTILKKGKKPSAKDDAVGDYVDFEEVD